MNRIDPQSTCPNCGYTHDAPEFFEYAAQPVVTDELIERLLPLFDEQLASPRIYENSFRRGTLKVLLEAALQEGKV